MSLAFSGLNLHGFRCLEATRTSRPLKQVQSVILPVCNLFLPPEKGTSWISYPGNKSQNKITKNNPCNISVSSFLILIGITYLS